MYIPGYCSMNVSFKRKKSPAGIFITQETDVLAF